MDGDNGPVDGSGISGYEYASCTGGISATFNPPYPTMAGLVWTDGKDPVSFEAYDEHFNLIADVTANHADGMDDGATAEDRFYGLRYASGIREIRIVTFPIGGPICNNVIDHLQFGSPPF